MWCYYLQNKQHSESKMSSFVPLANRHVHHLVVRRGALVEHRPRQVAAYYAPERGRGTCHGCKRCTGRLVPLPRIALRVRSTTPTATGSSAPAPAPFHPLAMQRWAGGHDCAMSACRRPALVKCGGSVLQRRSFSRCPFFFHFGAKPAAPPAKTCFRKLLGESSSIFFPRSRVTRRGRP